MHSLRHSFAVTTARSLLLALALLGSASTFAVDDARQPVNINQANAEALAANLKGIGLRRAQEIVSYRETNGPFRDAYELMAIKGIGERIVADNESRIRLAD